MVKIDAQKRGNSSLLSHSHLSLGLESPVAELVKPRPPLLQLREVSKVSSKGLLLLDRVSFHMEKGEFLLLVGPNRAGKTTLLRLIAGEERPTAGRILFAGFDSSKTGKKQIPFMRRRMGRIFQDSKLIDQMNVFDNVALTLRIKAKKEKKIKDKVFQALGTVGLFGRVKAYPGELSYAEKQKVSIARAIAGDPLLLLADEPTSNLDDESANEVLRLLTRVNLRGTAILLATSDVSLPHSKLVRVTRMEKGKII